MSSRNVPTQERAKRTRQAILDAAAEAFSEHGYAAAAMSDIAARAGVTKGALTFHFSAKRAIAAALVEEFDQRRIDLLERSVEASGLQRIGVVLRTLAVLFRDDPTVRAAVRLQAERGVIDDGLLPPPFIGWIDAFTDLYTQAAEAGEVRPEHDPATLARITAAAFFGIQAISQARTGRQDIEERLAEFWGIFQTTVA